MVGHSQRAALEKALDLPPGGGFLPGGAPEGYACLRPSEQDRLNTKKHKAKDDKKPMKSSSRDRISSEDPGPDGTMASHEPIDPLVMGKYTKRLHTEVRARAPHPALPSLTPALCAVLPSLVHPVYSTSDKGLACDTGWPHI